MLSFFKKVVLLTVVGVITFATSNATNPKREFRSSWLTTVSRIDWPTSYGTTAEVQAKQKTELLGYLDTFEDLKMTSTCLQVRSMGDATYPSKYAPWSSYVTGERGKDPGWDPLEYFVEECHKRGLEAYVWLNPYRWSSGTDWSTDFDKEWLNNDMIITGDNGSYKTFNPALPQTRQLIVNVIKEILENYAIDGVIFDDYFYPSGGTTESSSAPDYSDYKAANTTLSIGDWRRQNVNDMVKDVYDAIQATRPDVRFGISPAGVSSKSAAARGLDTPLSYGVTASDWQYAQIYSDPLAWLDDGTIDFISPQTYWETTHSTAPFEPLTKWWSYAAHKFNRHYYSSQRTYCINETELDKQIEINRSYFEDNAGGTIHWKSTGLYSSAPTANALSLQKNLYSTPCLTPEIAWKSGDKYAQVANLTYNQGTLSWSPVTNGNAIIRYTVYAIPLTVSKESAMGSDGDGIDGAYLQRMVYDTTYTLDEDLQRNYWYAVCVFDGYGKEHEVAIINYPTEESDKPALIAPTNGAVVDWDAEFSWSEVADASYILEISEDENFAIIKCSSKTLWTNSATIDIGDLDATTKYFWRIRTSQTGKFESVSDVESFTTTNREPAPKTTLLSPDNGATLTSNFILRWEDVNCAKYIVEISPKSDFSEIKYTTTTSDNYCNVFLSSLGKGTFFWHVISTGGRYEATTSDSASFTIDGNSAGLHEAGYEIKYDDYDYYQYGEDLIVLSSLWFRSVDSSYNNITFGSSGSLNRTICATGDYVYMSGRVENSSDSEIYLYKFDALTGELIETLTLGSEGKVGYYPCNTVVKDSYGNVCIANLTINASNNPLYVWQVNTQTGALTQKAKVVPSINTEARIDHISITGNVATGNFSIYTAIKGSKYVVRWNYENGSLKSEETCTLKRFYPSSASDLGIAPRVIPIDDNSFFVNGGNTHLTRYEWATSASISDSFANNTDLKPLSYAINGGTFFSLDDMNFVVYPYSDHSTGYKFNVVKTDSQMSFASMELYWTLPNNGLGTVNSTTYQSDADYITTEEGDVILYLFTPGCGLCAYKIYKDKFSAVYDNFSAKESMKYFDGTLSFSHRAEWVAVYDLVGKNVQSAAAITSLPLNLNGGVYIIKAIVNGQTLTQKVLVK